MTFERHAPHKNCADDSSYKDIGSKIVHFKCKACGKETYFNARDEYKAHEMWMEHKADWFANNPKFAPSVRTLKTIKLRLK